MSGAAIDGDGLFERVTSGRVSDTIVEQIKGLIRQGHLTTGDRLPSERELSDTFGVSRVTVRDALRVLEAVGLVEIRVGAGGGAFITPPGPAHMAEGIANLLALRTISPDELTEARGIIEHGLLPTVCQRATTRDLTDLDTLCQQAQESLDHDDHYDVALSAAFHIRLARATHNQALTLIVESLHGPLLDSLLMAQQAAPQMGHRGTQEHRQIIAAIRDRNPTHAQHIMAQHVQRTRQRIHQRIHREEAGPPNA